MIRLHPPVITGIVVFAVLVFGYIGVQKATASTGCVVKQSGSSWSVNPDTQTATATFIVTGGIGCEEDVSVMSWNADTSKLPGDDFWNSQSVYNVQTQTLGAGTHSITVPLPTCSGYQADVIASGNPSPNLKPPGQGSFYDGKQIDGSGIVVASAVGDNKCPSPSSGSSSSTTGSTTKKKPKPTHTFTPATTVIPSTPPTTPILLASSTKPTTLPNTGPGQTIGLFVLVSTVAGLIHHGYHRRRNRMVFDAATIIQPSSYYHPHHQHPQHHTEHPQHEEHQHTHQS